MCNLYTERLGSDAVAAFFGVRSPDIASFNVPAAAYPGYPGMVVCEEASARALQAMTWGFPLKLKGMSPTAQPAARILGALAQDAPRAHEAR